MKDYSKLTDQHIQLLKTMRLLDLISAKHLTDCIFCFVIDQLEKDPDWSNKIRNRV
jgi:hypothetical protein